MKVLSTFLVVILLASIITAEVPPMMNYQGQLTDPGTGLPVPDDNYALAFVIYDATTNGNNLYQESHPVVAVVNGYFTVTIGQYVNLSESIFSDTVRWLGVTVGTFGVDPELIPRTRLVTAPFAFRVSTIEGASGGEISSDIHVKGAVRSGNSLILDGQNDRLLVSGGSTEMYFGQDPAQGNFEDVEVGVATQTPDATLHVNGSIYTLGGDGDANLDGTVGIGDITQMTNYLSGNTFLSEAEFAKADYDGNGKVTWDDMTMLSRFLFCGDTKEEAWRKIHSAYGAINSGNAFYHRDSTGIGTACPQAMLHVDGSIYTLGGTGDVNLDGNVSAGDMTIVTNYLAKSVFLTEKEFSEADTDGDGRVTWDDLAVIQKIAFQGNTKEQALRSVHSVAGASPSTDGAFYIGGNVGVGTLSPQGALDVSSTTGALIVPRMTNTERDALTAVNGMIIYNTTTNQFNFYENGFWVLK